jgi:capsular polysaccharide export protein
LTATAQPRINNKCVEGALPERKVVMSGTGDRHFLLLQGPCGGFFKELTRELESRGAKVIRIAFCGGDAVDSLGQNYIAYRRSFAEWPVWVRDKASDLGITDLVVYGDCRPYHGVAIKVLKPRGIRIHALEEGYIRPHWITYERGGVNGHSPLIGMDFDAVCRNPEAIAPYPDQLNVMSPLRGYVTAIMRHHTTTLFSTLIFPGYRSHREYSIAAEVVSWAKRVATWPLRRQRARGLLRYLLALPAQYHLVLLQLDSDSQVKAHSDFNSLVEFIEVCIREYAACAHADQPLVFKNHPLDPGLINIRRVVRELAARHKVSDRVFFADTGKLARFLANACTVVSINSTGCHQSLQRGIPTLVMGRAIYRHPGIVSDMRLGDFFRARPTVNREKYQAFFNFLRRTSQVNGGFYTRQGRGLCLKRLADMMWRDEGPYDAYLTATASERADRTR